MGKKSIYSKVDKSSGQPEQVLNRVTTVEDISVCQHIRKPFVVCSPNVRQSLDRMYRNFWETGLFNDPIS